MQEKQGVATRLLYQLYISLEKKKKAQISGTVMEIMQPAANAGLHKKEHEIYSDVCKGGCIYIYTVCAVCACDFLWATACFVLSKLRRRSLIY